MNIGAKILNNSVTKKTNNPIKNLENDLNRHFSEGDMQIGQRAHEKMLTIINH